MRRRPVRSWDPLRALRLIAGAMGLAVAIGLARTDDVAYLAERFGPLRGRHVANGAGAGSYLDGERLVRAAFVPLTG
jgi:hypothetical protein